MSATPSIVSNTAAAAVVTPPTDLVADAPGEQPSILERHMIDALPGALQHHAALDDSLANAGQRGNELAGMHQERRVEVRAASSGRRIIESALARLGAG